MSADDDVAMRALRERAKDAAPVAPSTPHLEPDVLAQMRAGDEDESLDDAYRHVASCAVCRARLSSAEEGAALVSATLRTAKGAPAPIPIARARKQRTRALGWLLAAAATFGLVAILLWRSPKVDPSPLGVSQRTFTGTMGTASSTSVPAADRNVELTLETEVESAQVIVCDGATGQRIHGAQPFAKDARGKLVVVLAPRFFGPLKDPNGDAKAWIFAGTDAAVQRALQALAGEPSFVESRVRAVTDANDVRLTIVTLAR